MTNTTHICPEFNTVPFDNKTIKWQDKLFIRGNVTQIMHFPLSMGKVITDLTNEITAAQATVPPKDFLILAYDPSPWKSELYIPVTKEVPGAENIKLSGTFFTKVFDGPYNHVPKWIKTMDAQLAMTGKKALKYYFYYVYCPQCAKHYGHNYVVAFTQLS